MPGLATDLNNTDFQGATDPDSLLSVRFFEAAIENKWQSTEQNRPVFDNVIMIEIMTPGSILNIVQRPALSGDKIKWPKQWRFFEATHNSGDRMQSGTPLEQWPLINKGQAAMLHAINFHSVDQIAGASDEQIQGIGMHGGMQPHAFREKARQFLNVAKNASYAETQNAELAKRDAEIAELKARELKRDEDFAKMQEQLTTLAANQKKPAGRPKVAA